MSILPDSDPKNQDGRLVRVQYINDCLGELGRQYSPDYVQQVAADSFDLALRRMRDQNVSPRIIALLESAWKLNDLASIARVDRLDNFQGQAVAETIPVATRLMAEMGGLR